MHKHHQTQGNTKIRFYDLIHKHLPGFENSIKLVKISFTTFTIYSIDTVESRFIELGLLKFTIIHFF